MMLFQEIVKIVDGKHLGSNVEIEVNDFNFDTRIPVIKPESTLFFAFPGETDSGMHYLDQAYQVGVRAFIVESNPDELKDDCTYCLVKNVKNALWILAQYKRSRYQYPILGVTGSNGKTTVKEWLYHVLSGEYKIERSPKSYNSQIGVPLALLSCTNQADFGIFEAGISKPGEMNRHQRLLRPEVGLFTGLGDAHQNNFESLECKLKEKIKLFTFSEQLIYNADDALVNRVIREVFSESKLFSWSKKNRFARVYLKSSKIFGNSTVLEIVFQTKLYTIQIPFSDEISVDNTMHCFCFLAYQNLLHSKILSRFNSLPRLTMRMERRKGLYQSLIINDSYSNDLLSLQHGLQHLKSEHGKIGLIISDFIDNYLDENQFYLEVIRQIKNQNLDIFVGIGEVWVKQQAKSIAKQSFLFSSTEEFIKHFDRKNIAYATLLVKGARAYKFENLVQILSSKPHVATLEINLDHIIHNLQYFRSQLRESTKVMVMLKAFSYGVGAVELAKILCKQQIDSIAVAYPNEGVELREAGITHPIVVLNAHEDFIDLMIDYDLEPEIFNFDVLEAWTRKLREISKYQYPVHVKINTGMNRLGFGSDVLDQLTAALYLNLHIKVESVFSHLVDSSSEQHRSFTEKQCLEFSNIVQKLQQKLSHSFRVHILNTNGILNYPEHQYNQVRLGIGLFGVGVSDQTKQWVKPVLKFSSTISQINQINIGESVGYNRGFIAESPMQIATVALGYADGLLRVFGNGRANVFVQGKPCSIVGSVCMDMCMIDITNLDVSVGDEVIVFDGKHQDLDDFAKQGNMISYEVLCSLSDRVERTYTREW
ncbi:MAG: bifunctional UDP-N-acetylmuramoyl-tripeptide:D-alanyl-D-alanine ligase/alanine racemase [Flavobacteriales bacterium]